jgi:hypothetical protein
MITIVDVLVGILCTGALTELVRHDGRLSEFRTKIATLDGGLFTRLLKGVIGCGYCLSHWMALVTIFLLILPRLLWPNSTISLCIYLVAVALAVTRGANLVNDIFKRHCRTPAAAERELQ